MLNKPKGVTAVVVASIAALGAGGLAQGATQKHHGKRHASAHTRSGSGRTTTPGVETELSGDTATQAKAAALVAVPNGTVTRASIEDPNDPSGAAYEVHVTKADGSRVEVLLDSSNKVLSINADAHSGRARHAGAGGPGNSAETELTGDAAIQAKAAALAAVPGGTVWRASTEDPKDSSGAAYEVYVTKSDGSEVEVLLDSAFKVIATNASPQHGSGGGPPPMQG